MKKLLCFLSLIFIFANSVYAQAKKNAPAAKTPAAKSTPAKAAPVPKLSSKEPSFAGFTGSFIVFGPVSGETRPFTMTVEYAQWFFEIQGTAGAGYLTSDLGDDVIAVLAYYKANDDAAYQPGLFDLMFYLDDAPIKKVSDLKFKLIGPAAAGSAVLNQAKTWNFTQGQVFKMAKYVNGDILKAQATYLDKSDIEREDAAAKKRVKDSIAKEEKRVKDSIAKEEKRVKDSISAHKKHVKDSIEQVKAAEEAKKKEAAAAKKKEEAAKKEKEEAAAAKKKDDASSKKKKKKAEDDDDDKPKKKKKKKVEDDDDDLEDDDDPPVKKKKKKK